MRDTPTPIMSSEAGGASIKIEQGVLYENSYGEGSKIKMAMAGDRKMSDSNLAPAADHIFNKLNDEYSIFQPVITIKTEPDMDIDDRHSGVEAEYIARSPNSKPSNVALNRVPQIRPTPTSKLIAMTNGTYDNKRRYVCTYENCTKSYGKSSHLRSHLTWHTGIKPFVCKEPCCGKGFTRSDELNRHIRTHTGEKPFECVQCTKKFSRSDHLTKHLATHTKQLTANNSPFTKKMKAEKNVTANSLSKTFTTMLPSGTNGTTSAQDMNSLDRPEPGVDYFKATSEDNLKIKQEIPERNTDYMVTMPNRESTLNPTLASAGAGISLKSVHNVAIKAEPFEEAQTNSESLEESNEPDDDAIMPEANLPPISQNATLIMPALVKAEETCILDQPQDSLNHMADSVYDSTRPFPCGHCAKNFKRQDDLNRHMRTHTGEKPFACTECEKRFMRSDHLKKHLKIHAKAR